MEICAPSCRRASLLVSVSPRFGTRVTVCASRCAATSPPLRIAASRRRVDRVEREFKCFAGFFLSGLCTPRPTLQEHHGREQGRVNREDSAKTCRQSEREGKCSRMSRIYLSLSFFPSLSSRLSFSNARESLAIAFRFVLAENSN